MRNSKTSSEESLILEGNMKRFADLAEKSTVSFDKELEKYKDLLEVVDFGAIERILRFCSDREYYNHYMKGDVYKLLLKTSTIENAVKETNLAARSDLFPDLLDVIEDDDIMLGKCLKSSDRVDYAKQLFNAAFSSKVRLDKDLNMMLIRKNDKSIATIDDYDQQSLAYFISAMVPTLPVSESMNLVEKIERYQNEGGRRGLVIQFNDCYLENGIVKKGMYDSFDLPRFFINRSVYSAVETGKTSVKSREVDDLILHLSNFDAAIRDRLVAVMSTVFLNSKRLKTRFNVSPRIYGRDGANGKTTFMTLVERAFGERNVKVVSIADLGNDRTMYTAANALIAIDGDSTGKTISDDSAANFKSLTSAELVKIRGLFKNEEQVQTCCMMMALSNTLPSTSDKSAAYLRRLEISRCDYQLTNDPNELGPNSKCTLIELSDEFFDEIYSDNAAQYLVEMLLIESQKLRIAGKLPDKPDSMKEIIKKFAEDNDSAVAFVNDIGLEKIAGYSIAHVKSLYVQWCEENDMTELKRKFNTTLEDRYGLVRKIVKIASSIHSDDNNYDQCHANKKATIRAWQFSDPKRNEEFFNEVETKLKEIDTEENDE